MERKRLDSGSVTIFSLLLIAGGIVGAISGVGIIVLSVLSLLRQQKQLHPILRQRIKNSMPAFVFFALIGLELFGWTIWKGVDLWRGLTEGYRWGKILFAAQIVKIDTPRFSYEFFSWHRITPVAGKPLSDGSIPGFVPHRS